LRDILQSWRGENHDVKALWPLAPPSLFDFPHQLGGRINRQHPQRLMFGILAVPPGSMPLVTISRTGMLFAAGVRPKEHANLLQEVQEARPLQGLPGRKGQGFSFRTG
jgi:hypothetical protein